MLPEVVPMAQEEGRSGEFTASRPLHRLQRPHGSILFSKLAILPRAKPQIQPKEERLPS